MEVRPKMLIFHHVINSDSVLLVISVIQEVVVGVVRSCLQGEGDKLRSGWIELTVSRLIELNKRLDDARVLKRNNLDWRLNGLSGVRRTVVHKGCVSMFGLSLTGVWRHDPTSTEKEI